ncbi:MAG TPA: hypothetical protein VJL89_00685 [Thermodesulfovibrionia bacterium]|nr:hypothetical protein [Thermodesulfovibrionia bacterium]
MDKETDFTLRPEISKEIDIFLEDFYPKSQNAGDEMSRARLSPSQLRGLENLIVSTTRFSEIKNYIKNQTGKDKKNQWIQVASLLLGQLDSIEDKARKISGDDVSLLLKIKMTLAQGWARQVITHYLYANTKLRIEQ